MVLSTSSIHSYIQMSDLLAENAKNSNEGAVKAISACFCADDHFPANNSAILIYEWIELVERTIFIL